MTVDIISIWEEGLMTYIAIAYEETWGRTEYIGHVPTSLLAGMSNEDMDTELVNAALRVRASDVRVIAGRS